MNSMYNSDLYEWDEAKRQSNLTKHLIDFVDIERFDWDAAVIEWNIRNFELRYTAIGYIESRLHFVVYTWRDSRKRIISLRVASNEERERYARS